MYVYLLLNNTKPTTINKHKRWKEKERKENRDILSLDISKIKKIFNKFNSSVKKLIRKWKVLQIHRYKNMIQKRQFSYQNNHWQGYYII